MRRRARTDANHGDIRDAFRATGAFVLDLSRVGHGCPDLLVAKRGTLHLVEVKDGNKSASRRKLTEDEAELHAALKAAGVEVRIITNVEQAIQL